MSSRKEENTTVMEDFEPIDGAAIAAQILRHMPPAERSRLISEIATKAPEVAIKLQDRIYNFEEVRTLAPQGLQLLIQDIEHKDLVMAFSSSSPQLKAKISENMSERKRLMVEEDISSLASVNSQEVKEAQWRILKRLDELRAAGAIRTEGKGIWV